MPRKLLLASPFVALVLTISACGDNGRSDATASTVAATDATPAAPSTTNLASDATAAATVDANTASVDEIAAALATNGVANADRWAREVAEYRPYDTQDPNLGELRVELAKYNPDPATLEAIIASLTV